MKNNKPENMGENSSNQAPQAVPSRASGEFLSMHQASKMTGYHQDYLGQMARSGKLEAQKMGRNWFTTKLAIDKMLGRVPKEEAKPVVASEIAPQVEVEVARPQVAVNIIREPVQEVREPEPVAVIAPVMNAEVTQDDPYKGEEVDMMDVEPVVAKGSMVRVNLLKISEDAGPNLQESLSLPQTESTAVSNVMGNENKNFYFRWQKLVGTQQKYKFEIARIREELHTVSDELVATKKIMSDKISVKDTRKGFRWPLAVAAGVASVCFAIVGTAYVVSDYFSDISSSLISTVPQQQDKMVAGESTDVYSELLWPPPMIKR